MGGVQAKAAQLHFGAGMGRQWGKVIGLGGVTVAQPRRSGKDLQAEGGNETARNPVCHQHVVAGGVKGVGITGRVCPCTKAVLAQRQTGGHILRTLSQMRAVDAAGQGVHIISLCTGLADAG